MHYLTGQNWGLSALKNIWPVIMTGNLLTVLFSPDDCKMAYFVSVKLCTTRSFFHTFIIHTWNKVCNINKAIAINNNFNKCPYIQLLATSYTYDILYTKASSSSNEGKYIKNNKI